LIAEHGNEIARIVVESSGTLAGETEEILVAALLLSGRPFGGGLDGRLHTRHGGDAVRHSTAGVRNTQLLEFRYYMRAKPLLQGSTALEKKGAF